MQKGRPAADYNVQIAVHHSRLVMVVLLVQRFGVGLVIERSLV